MPHYPRRFMVFRLMFNKQESPEAEARDYTARDSAPPSYLGYAQLCNFYWIEVKKIGLSDTISSLLNPHAHQVGDAFQPSSFSFRDSLSYLLLLQHQAPFK